MKYSMYLHLKMSILFSITAAFASHAAIKGEDKRQKGKRVASLQVWTEQEENKKWKVEQKTDFAQKYRMDAVFVCVSLFLISLEVLLETMKIWPWIPGHLYTSTKSTPTSKQEVKQAGSNARRWDNVLPFGSLEPICIGSRRPLSFGGPPRLETPPALHIRGLREGQSIGRAFLCFMFFCFPRSTNLRRFFTLMDIRAPLVMGKGVSTDGVLKKKKEKK